MFDWVLNTPRNTITNFFPDISTLKLMAFWISTISFSYQYPSEAKANLEPSRTSTIEPFREICFSKIHKKTPVPESLFNKVICFCPAISRKETTPIHVFSDEFCETLLRHLFYWKLPGDCFVSTKKISFWEKKKWTQHVRKAKAHAKQKLNHYLHQVFISSYY